MKTSDYLTLDEAGARLGLDPETIRQYVAKGRLQGQRFGVMVLKSSVEQYADERRPRGRPVDADEN